MIGKSINGFSLIKRVISNSDSPPFRVDRDFAVNSASPTSGLAIFPFGVGRDFTVNLSCPTLGADLFFFIFKVDRDFAVNSASPTSGLAIFSFQSWP